MSKWFWYKPLVHAYLRRERRVSSAVAAEHPITAKRSILTPLRRTFLNIPISSIDKSLENLLRNFKSHRFALQRTNKSRKFIPLPRIEIEFLRAERNRLKSIVGCVCRSGEIAFLLALCVCRDRARKLFRRTADSRKECHSHQPQVLMLSIVLYSARCVQIVRR